MSEAAPSRWLSDWKAGLVIIVLEIWMLLSLIVYYKVLINRYFHLDLRDPIIVISGIVIFLINYFAFVHLDVWKDYVKEFDQLPKETNRKGSWIVFGIALFVLTNLIFSFYLMSRVDWSRCR